MTTHAEDLIVDAIETGVRARGGRLVTDMHLRRGEMLFAVAPGGVDALGDKVSYSVVGGRLAASVFTKTKTGSHWVNITTYGKTNAENIATVVDAIAPEHDDDWTDEDLREAAELDPPKPIVPKPTVGPDGVIRDWAEPHAVVGKVDLPQNPTSIDGPLTVGKLLTFLNRLHPDTQVTIATDGWYVNVGEVAVPEDGQWTTVTLFPGDEFDARQV